MWSDISKCHFYFYLNSLISLRLVLGDGGPDTINAMLATQLAEVLSFTQQFFTLTPFQVVTSGQIKEGSIIQMKEFVLNSLAGKS